MEKMNYAPAIITTDVSRGVKCYLDFAVMADREDPLIFSYAGRPQAARALAQGMTTADHCHVYIRMEGQYATCNADIKQTQATRYKKVAVGSVSAEGTNKLQQYLVISPKLGRNYFISSEDESDLKYDLYNFLMKNFLLPLRLEWMPVILKKLQAEGGIKIESIRGVVSKDRRDWYGGCNIVAAGTLARTVKFGNRSFDLGEMVVVKSAVSEPMLEEIISNALANREIFISDENHSRMLPVCTSSLDGYLQENYESHLNAVVGRMNILSNSDGYIDALSVKSKVPYPRQGTVIDAMAEKLRRSHYVLALCGMGVGKTAMSIYTVEHFYVKRWLNDHPKATLADCYKDPHAIAYRVFVQCPTSTVDKWYSEIRDTIPYSKVTVVDTLEQLFQIQKHFKEPRSCREFYILGKEFAKIGSTESPRPTKVITRTDRPICKYCWENEKRQVFKYTCQGSTCPKCGGKDFIRAKDVDGYPIEDKGLQCPECGEVILRKTAKGAEALGPFDFFARNDMNRNCSSCGATLWGVEAVPNNGLSAAENRSRSKWKRMMYLRNHTRKTQRSVFVRAEDCYYDFNGVMHPQEKVLAYSAFDSAPKDSFKINDPMGTRKIAPARYISKHFPAGSIDFFIADEVHQYTGATAQAHAFHNIASRARKVIGLTGTLANGKASSVFQILWMLDPRLMQERGYIFGKSSDFVDLYGSKRIVSTSRNDGSGETGLSDRMGKAAATTSKEEPGISPLIFIDFFLENAVTLDLKDFKDQIPPFEEEIIEVPMEDALQKAYSRMLDNFKESLRRYGDKLTAEYNISALYMPDRPTNNRYIANPVRDGILFTVPAVFSESQLTNKEERLVGLVESELAQGRNCVIYVKCTGSGDNYITQRLLDVLGWYTELSPDEIAVLTEKEAPRTREKWIKDRAREGVKVIIANPKLVEVGLDFVFTEDGKTYNYPTIICYQIGYVLSEIWQATHRSWRLIQPEPCKVYYLCYAGTMQTACVEALANKEYAALILQGRFSEGAMLAATASNKDARALFAERMAKGQVEGVSQDEINNLFKSVNQTLSSEDKEEEAIRYKEYSNRMLFSKLTGLIDDTIQPVVIDNSEDNEEIIDVEYNQLDIDEFFNTLNEGEEEKAEGETEEAAETDNSEPEEIPTEEPAEVAAQTSNEDDVDTVDPLDIFAMFFGEDKPQVNQSEDGYTFDEPVLMIEEPKKKRRKKKLLSL